MPIKLRSSTCLTCSIDLEIWQTNYRCEKKKSEQ